MLSAGCGWNEPFHWAGQEEILQSPKGTFYTRLVPNKDMGTFLLALMVMELLQPSLIVAFAMVYKKIPSCGKG